MRGFLNKTGLHLFLAKPDRTIIAKLSEAYGIKRILRFKEVNELTFSIPSYVQEHHRAKSNKHIDMIKERYLIKLVDEKMGTEEWYVIDSPDKNMSENSMGITVECFSDAFSLSFKKIRGFQKDSMNLKQVMDVCLENTGWSVGYIHPDFLLRYRSIDSGVKTKLEFLHDICDIYGDVVNVFDTVNRKINFYKLDEYGEYRGLSVKEGKLIKSIGTKTSINDLCTVLYCYGANGMSIHHANPTGQSYLFDYNYYLYPFERDDKRNVIKHSYYMSDALCHAILDYQALVQSKSIDFDNFLDQLELKQMDRTKKINEKQTFENEYAMILDAIELKKQAEEDYSADIVQRDAKLVQINAKQAEIDAVNGQIESINAQIYDLQVKLSEERNFTTEQLNELTINYKHEKDFENQNITDPRDLYSEGWKYFQNYNLPPIDAKVDIVDLFSIEDSRGREEVERIINKQRKQLIIGDYIKVNEVGNLNIDIKARIITIEQDFESYGLNIEITNGKEYMDAGKRLLRMDQKSYAESMDIGRKKYRYDAVTNNFDSRNDRISAKPANPVIKTDGTAVEHTVNDDGTVNISFEWEYKGAGDAYKIDGFLVFLYTSDTNEKYIMGSNISKETGQYPVTYASTSHIFGSITANKYYTFGVQAYRRVDADIAPDGLLLSDIVQTNTPYQPSGHIAFKGDIIGTINGEPVSNVSIQYTGSYIGNGDGSSKTINFSWTPSKVVITGGKEKDGTVALAKYEVSNGKDAFVSSTSGTGTFYTSPSIRIVTNGFTYGNSSNLANVRGELYEWTAWKPQQ